MAVGLLNPEISDSIIGAPVVVSYSPIVAVPFTANRSEPDTAKYDAVNGSEISEGFTVAPEVVYLPITPLSFMTNRSEPDTTMAAGPFNPEISEAFTVAPEVVYSPTVPAPRTPKAAFVTNRSEPDTAMPNGALNPEISEAFTVAPEVVYSPTLLPYVTNKFEPDTAMAVGLLNPEISEAFTVAPEVVYSPIVPSLFATNIVSIGPASKEPHANGISRPISSANIPFIVGPPLGLQVYHPPSPPGVLPVSN
jgi:hypothetical protein